METYLVSHHLCLCTNYICSRICRYSSYHRRHYCSSNLMETEVCDKVLKLWRMIREWQTLDTQVHTHTHTHTDTHTHTQYSHTHTHIPEHTRTRAHTHTHTHTHTHACTRTHTHTQRGHHSREHVPRHTYMDRSLTAHPYI